ncbi:MAG: DUF438 domain-containing protein [Candidatus Aminicenantes bacterium]|nr:DUF438 domain-containing protein [Candidatus Aminicenantes bacterium]
MKIDAKMKIDDLLKKYPFLLDFLAGLSPRFARLKNPIMRKTIGRVATLQQVAGFGEMALPELLQKVQAEIKRVAKEDVAIETGVAAPEPIGTREARQEVLKDIIRELHQGGNLEDQKRRFAELIKDIRPTEISEMEQKLIEEGLPEEEVKRLCDVHVQVFKESLEGQPLPVAIPGHPLHTLTEENRALEKILGELKGLLDRISAVKGGVGLESLRDDLRSTSEKLSGVEKHYLREENQLFPLLEARGVSGPSKVMWAIHDDIRTMLREFHGLLATDKTSELVAMGHRLTETMSDMIYKEEKILLPMSLETLTDEDWARVRNGEEEIGYAWVKPGTEWKPALKSADLPPLPESHPPVASLPLDTGGLTPEQINLLLKNLPVDVTFVDETDTVRYYSAGAERIFPRSPAIIGRKVQNCHPPDSVHMVNRILEALREGRRDVAGFWIQLKGRFIYIRYFAVRDGEGHYKGCLEVSQDVTDIRGLQGEQRLLDWK